jgi:hypothetical protein
MSFLLILELIDWKDNSSEKVSLFRYFLTCCGLGIILGFLVLVRYNLAIWVILVGFVLLIKNWRTLPLIGLGGAPFAVLFLWINKTLYGGVFNSGYIYSGEQTLNLSLMADRLPEYIFYLNLIYPGLLIISLFGIYKCKLSKSIKFALILLISIFILFYSVSGGFLYDGDLQDVITGIRFFVPILPIFIIFYIKGLENHLNKLPRWILLIMMISLIGFNLIMSISHQRFTERNYQTYKLLDSLNSEESDLFVGDAGDEIYFGEHLRDSFERDGYINYNQISEIPSSQFERFDNAYIIETDKEEMLKLESQTEIINTENLNVYKVPISDIK